MKQILAIPLVTVMLSAPLAAQDQGPSLMERGAQLFIEGLIDEMSPALDEIAALLEEVDDWSVYAAPEVLPNGDIIIRRKPDLPKAAPDDPPKVIAPQIDL
jgi:hypothetical protein